MKWQNHIGLDIGSSTIKLVQLAPTSGERFKLVALGQIETPNFDDQIQWDQSRSEIVKKLVSETRPNSNQVVISLPETQVYTRVIEMPQMAEPDLSSTIRFQAEQYIPVPITDVVLKHQIMSTPEQGVPGAKMSVLLVAAPNAILARYTLILSKAGLSAIAVETEILSVGRAIIGAESVSPTSLLVHLGAESTTLAIFKNGLLVLVQSVSSGGAAIIRSVSSQLGLDFKQAEEYVKSYGLDATKLEAKVANGVKPVVELILSEIRRVVAFYQTRDSGDPIKRMVLTGGMALLPGLVEHFTQSMDLEVQMGDPFGVVDLTAEQKKEIGENGALFATAVGLALKLV